MTFGLRSFIVAILSGLLSTLLALSFNFAFFTPLPIFLVALRFGNFSGLFASVVSLSLIAGFLPEKILLIQASLIYFLPTLLATWLLRQRRPNTILTKGIFLGVSYNFCKYYITRQILSKIALLFLKSNTTRSSAQKEFSTTPYIWFPVSAILFWMIIALSVGTGLKTYFLILDPNFSKLFQTILADLPSRLAHISSQQYPLTPEILVQIQSFIAHSTPYFLSALSGFEMLLCLLGNMYIALILVQSFSVFKRPVDYWPLALRLPVICRLFFFLSILLFTIAPNPCISLILAACIGCFLFAFFASGLAIVHSKLRAKEWKRPFLFGLYILLGTFLVYSLTSVIAMSCLLFLYGSISLLGIIGKDSGIFPISNEPCH